jgi:NADH-quinone oxidoreductase subunit J
VTESIAFLIASAFALLSAIYVVRTANLIHAALWLGLTLFATAGLYAMLGASFLAGIQLLLYIGGVITLMLFAVMITRRHDGLIVPADGAKHVRGAVAAVLLFGMTAAAIWTTPELDHPLGSSTSAVDVPTQANTADIGRELLGQHVLAFEVVSMLLLIAVIGAIVIARRRDQGPAASPAAYDTTSARAAEEFTP